jgi:multidrug efflux pump
MVDLKLAEGASLANTERSSRKALLNSRTASTTYVAYAAPVRRFYLPLDQQLPAASFPVRGAGQIDGGPRACAAG